MTDRQFQVTPSPFEFEAHISLAFSLRSAPGSFALLLGAGVSISAGVPSAWEVQKLLISQLALTQNETPNDPFEWFSRRYDSEPTYPGLLEALTKSPIERQTLLRPFFEPTAEDREVGRKVPTLAHRSIARLARSGAIHIVLTLNFDTLLEQALREEGVEPTVVSSAADVSGMNPLHTHKCLVAHLNGDYLHPADAMINTGAELQSYPSELTHLLEQVFSTYGLVVAGWSATWDQGLRDILARTPNKFFPTYWINPSAPTGEAKKLLTNRGAVVVDDEADRFFGRLADAYESITQSRAVYPLTVAIAVATAKRALSGQHVAIDLHDTIRKELEDLRRSDIVSTADFDLDTSAKHRERLERLEEIILIPAALIATTVYWGDEETTAWWFDDIERFAVRPHVGGAVDLIHLVQAPAVYLFYASRIAAFASRQYYLLKRLLTEPITTDMSGSLQPISVGLEPHVILSVPRASRRIFLTLRQIFEEHLALGAVAYQEAFERFEYLRMLYVTGRRLEARGVLDKVLAGELKGILSEPLDGTPQKDLERQLRDLGAGFGSMVPWSIPHLRAVANYGPGPEYLPLIASSLRQEIVREGDRHPLIAAGLFTEGGADEALFLMYCVDDSFGKFATEAAWSTLPHGGGALPSGVFMPDEIGKLKNAN